MNGISVAALGILLMGSAWIHGAEMSAGDAAARKPGEQVVFVDIISEVDEKPSGTLFLNFGGKFPDEVLTAVIMSETKGRFPDATGWLGKKVRVEGELSEYKGHLRIILRERGQIRLSESE